MNDDEHSTGHPDPSELGRFLRDEVPAPGPGYWDAIDERLAAIGSDIDHADADRTSGAGDTSAEVIRLTDMTTRPSPRFRSAPILIGVAAALIVLLGLGVALTRGDDAQEVATDDGTPDTETIELDADPAGETDGDPADDDTDPDGDTSDGTGTDSDGSGPIEGDPAAIRYCYAGGELAQGVHAYADLSAPIEAGPTVRIASRTVIGDDTFYEVIDGTVSSDGTVTGQFTDLASGARFEAMFVFVTEEGLSLADDVFVEPADCADIADDITDIETAVNSVDLDEIAIPQPGTGSDIEFLTGDVPRLWTMPDQVEVFSTPGTDDPSGVLFFGQTRAGTGRQAQAEGEVWIELAAGETTPKLWARQTGLVEYIESANVDGVEFLEDDEELRIWTIVGDGTVLGLAQPGLDDEVVNSFEAGPQLLVGTARRAFADDQLWIQLEALPFLGGDDSVRSWVPRDSVELFAPDLSCYASPDRESEVLVVQFDQDAESFTGSLILRISELVTAEFFAAAGVLNPAGGSSFTVNVQEFGSPDIVTEEWRGVRDGFSLATRAFPSDVPCAFVVDSVTELAGYDANLIPPFPDPAG